jgi:hypothetical protein
VIERKVVSVPENIESIRVLSQYNSSVAVSAVKLAADIKTVCLSEMTPKCREMRMTRPIADRKWAVNEIPILAESPAQP